MIHGRKKTAKLVSSSAQPSSRLRISGLWAAVAPLRLYREAANDPPVDGLALVVDDGADALGHRCVEQICADGGRRVEAEQQDQQRRHQRAAADPGEADERPDEDAGERIERVVHGENGASPLVQRVEKHENCGG